MNQGLKSEDFIHDIRIWNTNAIILDMTAYIVNYINNVGRATVLDFMILLW